MYEFIVTCLSHKFFNQCFCPLCGSRNSEKFWVSLSYNTPQNFWIENSSSTRFLLTHAIVCRFSCFLKIVKEWIANSPKQLFINADMPQWFNVSRFFLSNVKDFKQRSIKWKLTFQKKNHSFEPSKSFSWSYLDLPDNQHSQSGPFGVNWSRLAVLIKW